ncbi:MAG: hypothetical protein ACL7AX_09015 [Candidatus Arsenophonus phytopathogenicus]
MKKFSKKNDYYLVTAKALMVPLYYAVIKKELKLTYVGVTILNTHQLTVKKLTT